MCDGGISTIILASTAAASVGSSLYGTQQGGQAAKAQAKYQNKRYAENAANANVAYQGILGDFAARESQERQAVSQDLRIQRAAADATKAESALITGENGVAGVSIQDLMLDFDQQSDMNERITRQNFDWKMQQFGREKEQAQASAINQVQSGTPQPISAPSLLAAGLQAGAQVGALTMDYYKSQPRASTPKKS